MKKLFSAFLACWLFHSLVFAQTVDIPGASVPAPSLSAKSWVLMDATSHQVLASLNPDMRVEPASLTKIMTEYLTFKALHDGRLKMDQMVNVPVDAWKVDPSSSKMFLMPNTQVSIKDLLYGLIVQSGNDAAITLADAVAGDTGTFVAMMNQEAKTLGMNSSHFTNPHGLSDPNHYTTARDLSTLAWHLTQDFPEDYKTDSTKSFTYNKITQPNRNRLLWIDPSVDGIKTGHTSNARYCLISSAKRPNGAGSEVRMIAVVMGTDSDQARTQESLKLLNWGYQNFDTVKLFTANQPVATPQVWKGNRSTTPIGFAQDVYLAVPRSSANQLKTVVTRNDPLIAPLAKGQNVGTMKVMAGNTQIAELPLVALEAVGQASILGRAWDSLRLWMK